MDDKTICTAENTIEALINFLEKESQGVINWFKSFKMTVNPNKLKKNNEMKIMKTM